MAGKWMNKRAQSVNEALNKNADKTEFDSEFVELEKKTDATSSVVDKIIKTTPVVLHPNPADKRYPHAYGELAELMKKGGAELGEDSNFGGALLETGEALDSIVEANHALDADVIQNFLEPLKVVMDKDMKEIMKHRKKLEGRRLDFDYKRRKQSGGKSSVTDADIKIAEQKLEESKSLSESGMINLLENDVEQVGQLAAFVEAELNYHRQCAEILANLTSNLADRLSSASSKPKKERKVVQAATYDDDDDDDDGGQHNTSSTSAGVGGSEPCARAVFDFDAENEGEISFKEGDMIKLKSRLDDNWLEGEVRGQVGIFPTNYVEIVVDF